jgi:hypothetical protein
VRRAGRIEVFNRPDDNEREKLFKMDCEGLGFSDKFIKELVSLTGPNGKRKVGFTYSDIRTRLIPEALAKAYPERRISEDDLRTAAQALVPSPSVN